MQQVKQSFIFAQTAFCLQDKCDLHENQPEDKRPFHIRLVLTQGPESNVGNGLLPWVKIAAMSNQQ